VRCAPRITFQFKKFQLRYRGLKGFKDTAQARLLCFLGHSRDLLKKVTAVRIVLPAHGAVRLADQLRHNVQIAHAAEKLSHFAKPLVGVHLLQIRLREPFRVLVILGVRPREDLFFVLEDLLFRDERPLPVVLPELEGLPPSCGGAVRPHSHIDQNVGVLTGGKTTKSGNPVAVLDSTLKAASHGNDVPQEAKNVEEIGLAGGIGTDQKHPTLQFHVRLLEVLPVFQADAGESHDFLGSSGHRFTSEKRN
jgi:hypothetical protein